MLDKVGLNRPSLPRIPIWFGTESGERALRRVARLADGWMSLGDPTPDLPRLRAHMEEVVRGPVVADSRGKAAWVEAGKRLQANGVTHIFVVAPPDPIADCEGKLRAAGVTFAAAELPVKEGRGKRPTCGVEQAVVYQRGPAKLRYNSAPLLSCGMARP